VSTTALSTAGRFPVRRKRPNRPPVDNASRFVASAVRGPVHGAQIPSAFAQTAGAARGAASKMGRSAQGIDERGRGAQLSGPLGEVVRRGRDAGGLAAACGAVAAARAPGGGLGRVPPAGTPRLAQSGARHSASQERPRSARGVEKKLPNALAALLKPQDVRDRKVRLMFQDEARFGRMVRIRRCWAPTPQRPVVCNGYEREFLYVYGAVSPLEGQLDWMITRQMNTANMSAFLAQVHARHRRDFMVMVVDGASSHVAKDLVVPENIRLLRLPPYAPELNPQEHVWDELREKEFPNRVFADLQSVLAQLEAGLPRLASNRRALQSLTAWPWIVSLHLNAL